VPCWPFSEIKSQVYLCASWGAWSIKCSIERLDRQNRKSVPILIITEAKNAHFFKCTRSGFVHQELRDFVKMALTRVIDCDSSRVILWKTWLDLSRVTIFLNVTRVESESPKIVTRVESLTRVTLSLVWCSDELSVHSCPLLRLQTHVAKLASTSFYCFSWFRNTNMATNLQRFTSKCVFPHVTVDLRQLRQVIQWDSDCWQW